MKKKRKLETGEYDTAEWRVSMTTFNTGETRMSVLFKKRASH